MREDNILILLSFYLDEVVNGHFRAIKHDRREQCARSRGGKLTRKKVVEVEQQDIEQGRIQSTKIGCE
jgi:hypothetical protein